MEIRKIKLKKAPLQSMSGWIFMGFEQIDEGRGGGREKIQTVEGKSHCWKNDQRHLL